MLFASAERKIGGAKLIVVILLTALAMRAAILFTGQRWLRSDEAVVGLMAKHIVTRGERPIFLYGQPYGGGHAIEAYLAAPLFVLFGRSAVLLTAIPATLSLVNIWLVWLIFRRHLGDLVGGVTAALYAFSPPVVYQSFLVNGGTETFLLALVSLHFFLKSYAAAARQPTAEFLAGLFAGLAYWGMDYALLYPIAFAVLWATSTAHRRWALFARFVIGLAIGCAPLILYNFSHRFANILHIFEPATASATSIGFVPHVVGALWQVASGHLAAFFGGDIDDFNPGGIGAWLHAAIAVAAVFVLLYRGRKTIRDTFTLKALARPTAPTVPISLVPAVFVLIYLAIYAVARFSLPNLSTTPPSPPPPRYLLPLCPFLCAAIAIVVVGCASPIVRRIGFVMVVFLVLHGVVVSLAIGTRPWHEEHRIRTSGAEIAKVARVLKERNIHVAFTPYEIQWRLMFEADEDVIVSSEDISGQPRYPWYDQEAKRRVREEHADFVFILRRDFAFEELCTRPDGITREKWERDSAAAGMSPNGIPVGEEFVIYTRARP